MATKQDERLEGLHKTLVEKTAQLATSKGWLDYLATARKFHHYSLGNILLILAQCPEATQVAGFRKWNEFNRYVKKGETAIWILAPMIRKYTDEATGEEKKRVGGFRGVSVFDVSQTDGEPLPERMVPTLLEGEAPEGLWDALVGIATKNGYTVRHGETRSGENGFTEPATKTIQVTEGLSDAQSVKTLAHEIAHMLLHTDDETLVVGHRGVQEVEAESVAYLVSTCHGLPTEDYTLPYVVGWSDGKPEVISATAERVLKTAREILAVTQPSTEAEEVEPARVLQPA